MSKVMPGVTVVEYVMTTSLEGGPTALPGILIISPCAGPGIILGAVPGITRMTYTAGALGGAAGRCFPRSIVKIPPGAAPA